MTTPQLSVVRADETAETPAARAQRLYDEAQRAAFDQVRALEEGLARVVSLANEVADGGEVYPAGVRDLCRRLGDDLTTRAQSLDALAARALNRR